MTIKNKENIALRLYMCDTNLYFIRITDYIALLVSRPNQNRLQMLTSNVICASELLSECDVERDGINIHNVFRHYVSSVSVMWCIFASYVYRISCMYIGMYIGGEFKYVLYTRYLSHTCYVACVTHILLHTRTSCICK